MRTDQDLRAAISEKFARDQGELIDAQALGPPERLEKAMQRMERWERFFAAMRENDDEDRS
jgi:hypothetical protein